ncbi:MAG: PEP/pyruvate-binding domain-containing protein [Desulfonatronovibrio sp.]
MTAIWTRLKSLFHRDTPALDPEIVHQKKLELRDKYVYFKQLLDANNSALRIMSEMNMALNSATPFDMVFITGQTTRAALNVYSMINHLNSLSGNRYQNLEQVFKKIETHIQDILNQPYTTSTSELILSLDETTRKHMDAVGSKMAVLGELGQKFPDLNIPAGFSITSAAYDLFMLEKGLASEIQRRLRTAEISDNAALYRVSSEIQMLIINSELPRKLGDSIMTAYSWLESETRPGVHVSLRSSAVGEDSQGTSFAGQYRSELNVNKENILEVYKEIIAAKYNVAAMKYRYQKGIPDHLVPMCVGCMEMVEAASAGVAYSRDPLSIDTDLAIVSSVFGLPKAVVDGSITPDKFIFSGQEDLSLKERKIHSKPFRISVIPGEGIKKFENEPDMIKAPSIDDRQAGDIADKARMLEKYFHVPVDMEWVLDPQGNIVILQARPLSGIKSAPGKKPPPEKYKSRMLISGGETASKGTASGRVYQIKNNQDLLSFPGNAIMVAAQALPRWASVLSSAAGVITEQGSVTGHLGNVAREFSVPAIFGAPGALKDLKNGMEITLDADNCLVYHGKIDSLLQEKKSAAGIMQGTRVHEILRQVLEFITPLNLTNPDSPEFRPGNCLSFHDITRFCHEKAVHEMFEMGTTLDPSRTGGKRLVVDVPMQWWVLDLDDGFKEPVPGKNVHISNIQSVPMLSLWQGITALPWEGPPPMDGRGFMSVMVQATSNPDLSSTGPSVYSLKNFFMISKYFCNLTSRMGFHFSTVETLVGDKAYENYARFSFKGGAADESRRLMRTDFIAQLLREYDFQVETYEDSLLARIRGGTDEFMITRLQILGYITIHTRQLDMIMHRQDKVSYYYRKIKQDIEQLFQNPAIKDIQA